MGINSAAKRPAASEKRLDTLFAFPPLLPFLLASAASGGRVTERADARLSRDYKYVGVDDDVRGAEVTEGTESSGRLSLLERESLELHYCSGPILCFFM